MRSPLRLTVWTSRDPLCSADTRLSGHAQTFGIFLNTTCHRSNPAPHGRPSTMRSTGARPSPGFGGAGRGRGHVPDPARRNAGLPTLLSVHATPRRRTGSGGTPRLAVARKLVARPRARLGRAARKMVFWTGDKPLEVVVAARPRDTRPARIPRLIEDRSGRRYFSRSRLAHPGPGRLLRLGAGLPGRSLELFPAARSGAALPARQRAQHRAPPGSATSASTRPSTVRCTCQAAMRARPRSTSWSAADRLVTDSAPWVPLVNRERRSGSRLPARPATCRQTHSGECWWPDVGQVTVLPGPRCSSKPTGERPANAADSRNSG